MKGRGRKRLMAGALCLAMLFADADLMSLRVVASEVGQEVSVISDSGNDSVTTENNGEEEKGTEDTSSVPKDDDGQNGSVGNEGGIEGTVSPIESEEETENGAVSTEGSSDSDNDDEEKPSEGNGSAGSEAGTVEGNSGTGSETDIPETGDNVSGEADSVEGSDGETEGDKIQDGESAVEGTVSENTVVTSEELEEDVEIATLEAQAVTASGKCGDNLKWELVDGTLTISGTGEMWDYYDNPSAPKNPWKIYSDKMKNLNLGEGITTIGVRAFEWCDGLSGNLVIPNSVTRIGESAFSWCRGFSGSLVIPDNVTEIGRAAFVGCDGFNENLIIPNGVVTIGRDAFYGCEFTGALTLPSSLTEIGAGAFIDCSGFTGNLVIPNSVTEIGAGAFLNCSGFTGNLIISENITQINESVFEGCSGLTGNLVIPNTITEIGQEAFEFCSGFTGNLIIPDKVVKINGAAFSDCSGFNGNLVIPNSVTEIGVGAFTGCKSLTGSLSISNNVTVIGREAFSGCSGFNGNLLIPKGIIKLEDSVFQGCAGFTGEIKIPNSITEIGSYVFRNCSGFTGDLIIPDGVTKIGREMFTGCSRLSGSLVIGAGIEEIPYAAFEDCSNFTGNLIIGQNVKKICGAAFNGCSGFTGNLVIPDSVTEITGSAFGRCGGFTGNLIIGNNVTDIGSFAFNSCDGFTGNLTIGNNVRNIGQGAFEDCSGFTGSLIIPDSVLNIGECAFRNCSGFTDNLIIGNGVTKIEVETFDDCSGFTGRLTIGNNITEIENRAFYGCGIFNGNLEIPNSVETIGEEVFANGGCTGNLILSNNVKNIGNRAFDYCSSFTGGLTIPNSVETIGDGAFGNCSGFTGNLTIGNNVTSIGYSAFADCSNFTGTLIIPNSVTNIGRRAFEYCNRFTGSLVIPDSVTSIEECAFCGCNGFTGNLIIPDSVTSIEKRAFSGCSGFTGSLTIPSSVTEIGESAFENCSGFTGSLTIPSSMTEIGKSVFENCSGFTGSLTIPNSVTEIEANAFNGCSGFIGNLTIPNGVTYIGASAFSGCSSFTGLVLPNRLTTISNGAFMGCSGFTGNLIIPNSITAIGYSLSGTSVKGAFEGCSGITSLTLPNNVTRIGAHAFKDCSGLNGNLKIPETVTEIGANAFENCGSITGNLFVPSNVQKIGKDTFSNCVGINNIIFEGNAPAIGTDAFKSITAKVYYPSWRTGWDSNIINKNYGGALTWIPYTEGFNPWEMDGDSSAPGIWFSLETNPKKITYKDGYNCSQFDMSVTVMCMLPPVEAPTYDNVTAKIELSDGLSYAENTVNRSYTKNLGTMNFDAVQKQNISVPVYIDQSNITSEFQVTVSVTADGYESAQTKAFSIPVDLSVDRAESIVDAVERYTALDEIREVTAIQASSESYDEMMEKLFEYYNYDNRLADIDRIVTLSATHRESWDYNTLIQNEIFLSYQFYNYLNNTPNGVLARACLYGSGLVFNGEIMDWIDLSTYLDGDYPGVEKYKSMLEEFIEKESTQLEYYSTLQTTQSFINDSVGLCSKIEKGEVLKELGKQKNVVGVRSVFNDFCKTKINGLDGKDIVFNYEKTTPFMEAMDVVGTGFKMTNMTIDGIMDFVDVSANLEIYESYHNFLQEIYEADDLPWELVAAAYKLDEEMKDAYWTPVKKILNTIRDECFDKALDLKKFSIVVEANSYLAMINYTAFVINQFVDVGKLVVNSYHTEGYAFLQMHYRNKLVQYKNEFVADKTSENAWKFYEAYIMLWKLRAAGEEKYLEMNRLEGGKAVDNLSQWATGGTLSGLLSDMCGYKDLEEATKQNLELLDKVAFKFNQKDIPDELMYLRKTIMECPVNVELISPDGTLIASLNDNEEISVSNDYGKFVSFYRATTGDYVKIAYFNNAEPITVKAIGTENGKVSYTYVETQNHETYDVSGFNNVLVRPGSSIQIKTDQKTYAIDQDADSIVDIEGEQADKKRIFVQFDYQDGRTIKIVYADQDGHVILPDVSLSDKKDFSGWYTEPEGAGEEFTAGTIVKASRTVYAKWGEVEKFYTVTFDSNNHGDIPAPYTNLAEGAKIEEPTAPVAEGYTFTGWYKEQSCENKWDFAVDTVQEDITLYAGWTENGAEKLYRVNFDTLNHGTTPEAYTDVKENSRISEPEVPTAEGYRFIGWFKDNKCTVRWQFGTDTVTSDITLYAGWVLDDDYGDILDEDIPASGIIPAGLWIAEVSDYLYTGKAIKPEAHVYDGKTRLKKGQDYTVTYKNNTNAGDASASSKAPTIVVKGKGNYAGTETETFTIQHVSLNDPEIVCDSLTAAYTGKVQKKLPSISYRGKKLSNNKEFTVSYPDLSRGITEAYCAPGTYDILLTAKDGGNYAGSRTVKFIITKNILLSKASVKKIPDQPYTGKAVEPELAVTLQNTPLIKNTDYTVTYMNNKEAGKATAVLSGIGDYAGTKKVTFNIAGTSLKKAKINKISDQTYNGLEQKPDVSVSVDGISLRNGTDYQITYANNLNVGTGTVTIKGINAYTGSIKKTFRINAYNLKEDTANRIGGLQTQITSKYLKGGSKPKIELTYAGKRLVEGVDYTLSYKNNKALTALGTGKLPVITIKGKGNFNGSITKTFTIISKALDDKELPVTLRVADMSFIDKLGNYISKPILIDADGKKLVPGKDYSNNIIYERENGTLLDKNDELVIGDKVKVTVKGKGAYSGELEAIYEIKPEDFNKAKITIAAQSYTGSDVVLDQDDITVRLNDSNLKFGTDYEIVDGSYTNNIKKGTAEVTIAGKGKYGGMKTIRFRIVSRRFQWFWRLMQ